MFLWDVKLEVGRNALEKDRQNSRGDDEVVENERMHSIICKIAQLY